MNSINNIKRNIDAANNEGGGAAAETVAPEAAPVQTVPIVINEKEFSAVQVTQKKGKNAGSPLFILSLDGPSGVAALAEAVGADNWHRTVMAKIVRPACSDASHEAIENGAFIGDKYVATLKDWFSPAGRRSGGPTKSELIERRNELTLELTPIATALASGTATEEQTRRLGELITEIEELSAKIEKKTRVGGAKK